ncbi:MAG: alpha/beta fold hydrolase [Bacteroidota bacterium]
MKTSILFTLSIGFSLFFLSWQRPVEESSFRIKKKGPIKVAKDQLHTFGYLRVPENRQQADTKMIELPVYIFKSRNKNPQKDPIIWLTGGPGSSLMNSARYSRYFSYLEDRDFILIEQRGTQYAKPHLDCPEWAEAAYQARLIRFGEKDVEEKEKLQDKLYEEAAKNCRERLRNKGIDLNGYHTREIAADVHDLSKLLGLEQYNILSLSYGTKIAQVLMRDYPENIRSVVMDSPLPLQVSYDTQSLSNLREVYEAIFADCAADPACNKTFPKLRDRFYAFLREKNKNPLQLKIYHQEKKEEILCYVKGKDIFLMLGGSSTPDMASVPRIIEEVLSGNYQLIESYLGGLSSGSGSGQGMRLSVWCAEETPFVTTEAIEKESNRFPESKGAYPAVFGPEVCEIWGVKALDERANEAIQSPIPTLIISGEFDTDTPVGWGELLSKSLPNSHHLIFRAYAHTPTTYWDNPCGMETARAFYNDPDKAPKLSCLAELEEFRFTAD